MGCRRSRVNSFFTSDSSSCCWSSSLSFCHSTPSGNVNTCSGVRGEKCFVHVRQAAIYSYTTRAARDCSLRAQAKTKSGAVGSKPHSSLVTGLGTIRTPCTHRSVLLALDGMFLLHHYTAYVFTQLPFGVANDPGRRQACLS